MPESSLSDLHDILLPSAPSLWPPALGWWLLALLLLIISVLVILVVRYALRQLPRRRARLQALAELLQLENEYRQQPRPVLIARGISSLLKRCSLFAFPRVESAGLAGHTWLDFLDRHAAVPFFSTPQGEWLARAPYINPNSGSQSNDSNDAVRAASPEQVEALIHHTRGWIHRNLGGKS